MQQATTNDAVNDAKSRGGRGDFSQDKDRFSLSLDVPLYVSTYNSTPSVRPLPPTPLLAPSQVKPWLQVRS